MFACGNNNNTQNTANTKETNKTMKKEGCGIFRRTRSSGNLLYNFELESNNGSLQTEECSDVSPATPSRTPKKKVKRRPSGTILFSWGKCDLGDDISVASSMTSHGGNNFLNQKEESLRRMELKGEELLKNFRKDYKQQKQVLDELNTSVQVHLDRAKARMDAHNSAGAVISMKRVKHFEGERDRVAQALNYLKEQETALHNRLDEATAMVALGDDDDGNAFSSFSMLSNGNSNSKINFDLSAFQFVHDRMQQILAYGVTPSMDFTESTVDMSEHSIFDQELLDELAIYIKKDALKQKKNAQLQAVQAPQALPCTPPTPSSPRKKKLSTKRKIKGIKVEI